MEETILSSVNGCSFHQNQLYEFYCRDCKDCVCVECLRTLHKKHIFCNMENAKGEIRQKLHNYILQNQEESKKLDETLDLLQQKSAYLKKEKFDIEQDIENLAENMKLKIDTSRKELLSSLDAVYEENNASVILVCERLHQLRLNLTKLKDENFEEYSFLQVVNIVCNLRNCIKSAEDIDKILRRPILEQNSTVGNIGMLAYRVTAKDDGINHVKSKSTVLTTISVHTQTENQDDVDSDVEWFDAEDLSESEYGCENSSDELKNEYPLTIALDDDKTNISKIVPISNQDAWVIANTNLQKIKGLILEKEIFAKSVDDIAVLEDGSLLVLSRNSYVIMRLLPNKRLTRFVSVSSVPHCICRTADKSVLIMLRDATVTRHKSTSTNNVVQINQDSIKSSEKQFERYWNDIPFAINALKDGYVYVLYRRDNINGYASILKINKNLGYELKEFQGVCGMEPAKDFQCYGILCDYDNILVSDSIHHKVYALDKDLKFKKGIVDASHGLESPKAIALNDNLLWVSDRSKIFIFKYDQYK